MAIVTGASRELLAEAFAMPEFLMTGDGRILHIMECSVRAEADGPVVMEVRAYVEVVTDDDDDRNS